MGLFQKLFGKREPAPPEHAVLVHLPLSDGMFGTEDERAAMFALEEALEERLEGGGAGELDGDEFGGGECVLFLYGPDADSLFGAIEPVLRESPAARGGYAVKRYGAVDDPGAREARVEL